MVGIIPKTTEKTPLWQDILFYFLVGLFLSSVFSFFLLGNLQKRAEASLRQVDEALAQKITDEETNLEKEIKMTEKQLDDFSPILDFHNYPSKIFEFLPEIIHPKARFKQISFDAAKSEINISGETESLTTLQQQIFIFQKEQLLIKNFTLNSFSTGEKGKINFSFNLSLSPQIFNQ